MTKIVRTPQRTKSSNSHARYSTRNSSGRGESLSRGKLLTKSSPNNDATKDIFKKRLKNISICIAILFVILWSRLFYIQIIVGKDYAKKSNAQYMHLATVSFPRGMITDRNGIPLARSVECKSVIANPMKIANIDTTSEKLATILDVPKHEIFDKLNKNKQFVWIARRLSDATSSAIAAEDLPGITLITEYERVYPYKHLAGQLIGFTGQEGRGLEGLERSLDSQLAGTKAKNVMRKDPLGRLHQSEDSAPINNTEDISITIDLHIQSIAEELLSATITREKANWGGMLVVDVPTGDILAWAQAPLFNPNLFRNFKQDAYRNRIAMDAWEPGSTFKPFLVASAMKEGIINSNSQFDCENGEWVTRTITIRDDGKSFGYLPVHRIVAESSNIGCAKIGHLLGAPKYQKFLSEIGFGTRLGLPIPESKGILRSPKNWGVADSMSAAFGQSVSVTLIQMAQAYLTLANFGKYRPLNLLMNKKYRIPDNNNKRIVSKTISTEVLAIMKEVVENGTGKRAAVKGLSIAGKTGTAQKADKHGKYGDKRIASFVGITPAELPRTLIIVILDEPQEHKYGGHVAAPLFKSMLVNMLAYRGELPDSIMEETLPAHKMPDDVDDSKIASKNKSTKTPKPTNAKDRKDIKKPNNSRNSQKTFAYAGKTYHDLPGHVPNVVGKGMRQAVERFAKQGILPTIMGTGDIVSRQEPMAGTKIPNASGGSDFKCTLWLTE